MTEKQKQRGFEMLFHLILVITVFIFYAFDRRDTRIEEFEIVFFLNYVFAAYLINFWLLPRFLYRQRYLLFGVIFLVLLTIVILIEEGVVEQIYFPETRGKSFPGVFENLLDILPVVTILVGFKFAWDAFQKQRQVDELKHAVKESELQFLKSQINPHFLFNNLNNLYAYALEKSEKTPEIILELSGVLRYMLYECREEYVPLKQEIEQVENFINLSKLQFENRGEVQFKFENRASQMYTIAPFLLTVFIENAFKHSASSKSDDVFIQVELIVEEDGHIAFYCENNYSEETNTKSLSHGIGLENVKKRLQLLYPNDHSLMIKKHEGLYQVTLAINLNKNEG